MIDYTFEEESENKTKAKEKLRSLKDIEKGITFYKKRINSKTVVMCKNKDRISAFEEQYGNIKNE